MMVKSLALQGILQGSHSRLEKFASESRRQRTTKFKKWSSRPQGFIFRTVEQKEKIKIISQSSTSIFWWSLIRGHTNFPSLHSTGYCALKYCAFSPL